MHNQPHATNHRSLSFTVSLWLLLLSVSDYTDAVYMASLLQMFCWIRRSVKSAGIPCQWYVYILFSPAWLSIFLVFCAAVSSQQAVLLLLKF